MGCYLFRTYMLLHIRVSKCPAVFQWYTLLMEDFLKGDHPAVVRSRTAGDQTEGLARLILFHLCITLLINKINWQSITSVLFTGNPAPQVNVQILETEPGEAGPSHGNYIIPTSETSSGGALDAVRCKHWIRPERTFNPTTIQLNFTGRIWWS